MKDEAALSQGQMTVDLFLAGTSPSANVQVKSLAESRFFLKPGS
jgi:hypothetical protein